MVIFLCSIKPKTTRLRLRLLLGTSTFKMSLFSYVYVTVAMTFIKCMVYLFEIVTLPVYNLFRKTSFFMTFPEDESHYQKFGAERSRVLSMPTREGDPGSPWRATEYIDSLATVALPGCQTLSELWLRTVRLWPEKKAFGTRRILKTDYEIQPNGRQMIKLTMGEYVWETYLDAEKRVSQLSAGLYDLLGAKHNAHSPFVIFSETRCEWLYAAQAAFRLSHPIATLYATLGDEALKHGLEQTESVLVFTSDELLYKIVHLLKDCPNVKYVVYFSNGVFQILSGANIDDLSRFNETARQSIEQARKEVPKNVKLFDILELEQRGRKLIERTPAGGKKNKKKKLKNTTNSLTNWTPPVKEKANSDDLAIIMYTSGSTGQPKGVELSHRNLTSSVAGYFRRMPKLHPEEDIYVGYLPLAHVLELVCETVALIMGIPIGYSNPQTLTDLSSRINHRTCKGDVTVLRPSLFVTVPTVLDRVSKTVWEKLKEGGPLLEEIFRFAFEFKRRRLQTGFPSFLLDRLIFRRVRSLMGGRIRYIVSGGAPLSEESQIFTNVCFAYVLQGYGLTETCAASTLMEAGDLRCHHVGAPTPSIQMKLREWAEGGYSPYDKPSPRGEILISGGSVSRGYYKNPEETANAFFVDSDGVRWFCTGDIGMIHEDGCFSIIDRKKDLVKLQGGEYVSLVKVELALSQSIYVENICVYADPAKNFTICFVSPKLSQIHKLASELGLLKATEEEVRATFPPERLEDSNAVSRAEHGILCKNNQILKTVLEDMQAAGRARKLASFEIPQKVYLDADPWTPDSGLVTDAMKIKRFNIKQKFLKELNFMYNIKA